ncbi:MAG: DNA-formamidopyrimidine glycosylase [Thermus sp.]|uniref:bifunctional DNA-formamidopyrimidine glycosylase/DNA-(apurinic or apyrimidinic site) lyase n=1 Tax=Thermus sp. TaxID=275 RepID=UPI00331716DA
MPELPEVEVTRRKLYPLVVGQRLFLSHRDPGRYRGTDTAEGQRVLDLFRRGKYLLFQLERHELVLHLGMTGGFLLWPQGASRKEEPPHTRVVFRFGKTPLYFTDPRRFGRIWVVEQGNYREIPLLQRMGPEPLSELFTLDRFLKDLRRKALLKPLLLSQEVVAGLGNIYADEVLFQAGLRPDRPAHTLSQEEAQRLFRAIREVLEEAIRLGGSTLQDRTYRQPDGEAGAYQTQHQVYGRAGKPCPRCGAPILRVRLGGRSTHFCPRCQA